MGRTSKRTLLVTKKLHLSLNIVRDDARSLRVDLNTKTATLCREIKHPWLITPLFLEKISRRSRDKILVFFLISWWEISKNMDSKRWVTVITPPFFRSSRTFRQGVFYFATRYHGKSSPQKKLLWILQSRNFEHGRHF